MIATSASLVSSTGTGLSCTTATQPVSVLWKPMFSLAISSDARRTSEARREASSQLESISRRHSATDAAVAVFTCEAP